MMIVCFRSRQVHNQCLKITKRIQQQKIATHQPVNKSASERGPKTRHNLNRAQDFSEKSVSSLVKSMFKTLYEE